MVIGTFRPYRRLRALWRALLGMLDSASGQALRRALLANRRLVVRGFEVGGIALIVILMAIVMVRQTIFLAWGG